MKFFGFVGLLALVLVAAFGSNVSVGQQKIEMRNNIPVAPRGLADRPLPKLPVDLDTAEGQRIHVVAVARGLTNPFGIAFLPDGDILVTERIGRLRIIRKGVLDPQPITGAPTVRVTALGGLLEVALH